MRGHPDERPQPQGDICPGLAAGGSVAELAQVPTALELVGVKGLYAERQKVQDAELARGYAAGVIGHTRLTRASPP